MDNESYEILSNGESVQLWLSRRLPFAPRGEMRQAKDELRSHLRSLVMPPGQLLRARYTSLDQSFCDAENILFYNVGASAFAHTCRTGLRFERATAEPIRAPSGAKLPHYHCYSIWREPERVAALGPGLAMSFDLHAISSSTKPHVIWWRASVANVDHWAPVRGEFELEVSVESPLAPTNLAGLMKPLLDGVISALHSHAGVSEEAIRRLCASTGWLEADVRERFVSPVCPALGEREVVSVYRSFVKWNPADHLCSRCTLKYKRSDSSRCVVRLFETV